LPQVMPLTSGSVAGAAEEFSGLVFCAGIKAGAI
jgi:hypothetical protein